MSEPEKTTAEAQPVSTTSQVSPPFPTATASLAASEEPSSSEPAVVSSSPVEESLASAMQAAALSTAALSPPVVSVASSTPVVTTPTPVSLPSSPPQPVGSLAASVVASSEQPRRSSRSDSASLPIDTTLISPAAAPSTPSSATAAAATIATAASPVVGPPSLRGIPSGLKVLVNFRPLGSAPIMKRTKFTLSASHRFGMVTDWLRKTLHFKPQDSLVVLCNGAFQPNIDSSMYDLFQCYQVGGELILNYATQGEEAAV